MDDFAKAIKDHSLIKFDVILFNENSEDFVALLSGDWPTSENPEKRPRAT